MRARRRGPDETLRTRPRACPGDLTDREWSLLEPHLPSPGAEAAGGAITGPCSTGFCSAVRTDVPWRDLPDRYSSCKTVYERHRRWSPHGTWDRLLQAVQADADLAGRIDWGMVGVDSASFRAHQAGGPAGAAIGAPDRLPLRPLPRPDPATGRMPGAARPGRPPASYARLKLSPPARAAAATVRRSSGK
ncbi:transposase [Streptomyces anulatus]